VSVLDHGELCGHPRGSSAGLLGSDFTDFLVIAAEEPFAGVQDEFDHVIQVLLVWVRPKKGEVDLDTLLLALWPKERQNRAQVDLIERFLERLPPDGLCLRRRIVEAWKPGLFQTILGLSWAWRLPRTSNLMVW
jgi:hypothetical protein